MVLVNLITLRFTAPGGGNHLQPGACLPEGLLRGARHYTPGSWLDLNLCQDVIFPEDHGSVGRHSGVLLPPNKAGFACQILPSLSVSPRIITQSCSFRQKGVASARHLVPHICVFKHIAGSTFIFNISLPARVLSNILLP